MISDKLTAWGESHRGFVRKINQDRFLIKKTDDLLILAVADGMGGHAGGEIAAQIVIDAVNRFEFAPNNLKKDLFRVLAGAQAQVKAKAKANSHLKDMGTTLTLAAVSDSRVHWLHVGDSRLYRFSGSILEQISTDHTFLQDFISDGSLTPAQAETHPLKNMLDQCVGMDDLKPEVGQFSLHNSDCLLLCSDGLSRYLGHDQIQTMLEKTGGKALAGQQFSEKDIYQRLRETAGQFLDIALKTGGKDNITVVLCRKSAKGFTKKCL